jgi:hypothetical protein
MESTIANIHVIIQQLMYGDLMIGNVPLIATIQEILIESMMEFVIVMSHVNQDHIGDQMKRDV